MPAPKDPEELLIVYAVRIPARDLRELKSKKINLGPFVRELVAKLLGKKGESVRWKPVSK